MKYVSIILFCVALVACSGPALESSQRTVDWPTQVAKLERLDNWENRGSLAVKSDDDGFNANIAWIQTGESYQFSISAPLSSQNMKVFGEPGHVTLLTGDEMYTASRPEHLLADHLGWFIPVSNIKYWIRALPVPDIGFEEQFDRYNRLYMLRQDGWRMLYQDYTEIDDLVLPSRIELTNPELRIRLVIRRWQL